MGKSRPSQRSARGPGSPDIPFAAVRGGWGCWRVTLGAEAGKESQAVLRAFLTQSKLSSALMSAQCSRRVGRELQGVGVGWGQGALAGQGAQTDLLTWASPVLGDSSVSKQGQRQNFWAASGGHTRGPTALSLLGISRGVPSLRR
jgi:hypothetical protein